MSKGYYILTDGEFSKFEISQNLVYVGSHLVLVIKGFANATNTALQKNFLKYTIDEYDHFLCTFGH